MKAFKKFTALFLALLMITSAGAALTFNTAADTVTPLEPEADGKYYIDDVADFEAFVAAVNADTAETTYFAGEEVFLRGNIDLSSKTYTASIISNFYGTLNGNNYSIIGLTIKGTTKNSSLINNLGGTIKNISFTDVEIAPTGTSADVGLIRYITADTLLENIYLSGTVTVTGQSNIAGLVSRLHPSCTMTANFKKCVVDCDVTANGKGGGGNALMLGNTGNSSTANFEDCIVMGSVICPQVGAGFVGFGTGHMSFTRCVSVADVTVGAYNGAFVYLDHQNRGPKAQSYVPQDKRSVTLTDCYVAYTDVSQAFNKDADDTTGNNGKEYVVNYSNAVIASPGRGFGFDLTIVFGDKTVFEHKWTSAETTASAGLVGTYEAKQVVLSEAIDASGMCIAKADVANLMANNFGKTCSTLAEFDWVVTAGDVTYKNAKVPEILPKTVANMLRKTALTSPTGAKSLQVRDNGTSYDVRIVGTVNFTDSTAYDYVGFEYSVKVKGADAAFITESWETSKVFTSILADSETVKATDEGINAAAFNLIEFCGFADGDIYEITVLSYAKKGEVITYNYAGAFTVTVQNGAVVQ